MWSSFFQVSTSKHVIRTSNSSISVANSTFPWCNFSVHPLVHRRRTRRIQVRAPQHRMIWIVNSRRCFWAKWFLPFLLLRSCLISNEFVLWTWSLVNKIQSTITTLRQTNGQTKEKKTTKSSFSIILSVCWMRMTTFGQERNNVHQAEKTQTTTIDQRINRYTSKEHKRSSRLKSVLSSNWPRITTSNIHACLPIANGSSPVDCSLLRLASIRNR